MSREDAPNFRTTEPGWVAVVLVKLKDFFVYRGDRYFCDTCDRELCSEDSDCCTTESVDNWKDGCGNVLYQTLHRSNVIRIEKRK